MLVPRVWVAICHFLIPESLLLVKDNSLSLHLFGGHRQLIPVESCPFRIVLYVPAACLAYQPEAPAVCVLGLAVLTNPSPLRLSVSPMYPLMCSLSLVTSCVLHDVATKGHLKRTLVESFPDRGPNSLKFTYLSNSYLSLSSEIRPQEDFLCHRVKHFPQRRGLFCAGYHYTFICWVSKQSWISKSVLPIQDQLRQNKIES